jgi:hypothetical protein
MSAFVLLPELRHQLFSFGFPNKEEVTFESGEDTLRRTIFWPESGETRAAIVILAGSDRSKRGP